MSARTFIAENGDEYPVGPCGFVPASAERKRRKTMNSAEKKEANAHCGPRTKGRKRFRRKFGG